MMKFIHFPRFPAFKNASYICSGVQAQDCCGCQTMNRTNSVPRRGTKCFFSGCLNMHCKLPLSLTNGAILGRKEQHVGDFSVFILLPGMSPTVRRRYSLQGVLRPPAKLCALLPALGLLLNSLNNPCFLYSGPLLYNISDV